MLQTGHHRRHAEPSPRVSRGAALPPAQRDAPRARRGLMREGERVAGASAQIVVPVLQRGAPPAGRRASMTFLAAEPDVGFVFVDDGSTDGTREQLCALAKAAPDRVQVLGSRPEPGQGRGRAPRRARGAGRRPALRGLLGRGSRDSARRDPRVPRGARDAVRSCEIVMAARVHLLGRRSSAARSATTSGPVGHLDRARARPARLRYAVRGEAVPQRPASAPSCSTSPFLVDLVLRRGDPRATDRTRAGRAAAPGSGA